MLSTVLPMPSLSESEHGDCPKEALIPAIGNITRMVLDTQKRARQHRAVPGLDLAHEPQGAIGPDGIAFDLLRKTGPVGHHARQQVELHEHATSPKVSL